MGFLIDVHPRGVTVSKFPIGERRSADRLAASGSPDGVDAYQGQMEIVLEDSPLEQLKNVPENCLTRKLSIIVNLPLSASGS